MTPTPMLSTNPITVTTLGGMPSQANARAMGSMITRPHLRAWSVKVTGVVGSLPVGSGFLTIEILPCTLSFTLAVPIQPLLPDRQIRQPEEGFKPLKG